MGLFKSKYRSKSGQTQYCLAGSVEGLKFLGNGGKFHFYNFLHDVNQCRLVSNFAPRIENIPSFTNYEEKEGNLLKSSEEELLKEIEDSLENRSTPLSNSSPEVDKDIEDIPILKKECSEELPEVGNLEDDSQ